MAECFLEPSLLIASPHMVDPNFFKSVVLLLESDQAGAMGLIINRITENRVRDILNDQGNLVDSNAKVWYGGPCSTDSGLLLHGEEQEDKASKFGDVYVSSSQKALRSLSTTANSDQVSKLYHFRFVVGYSGWGAQQLIDEVKQGAWFTCPIDLDLIFNTPYDQMWSHSINQLGIPADSLVTPQSLVLN